MAVRQAREEIRPGDRSGIGVGDVDLDLRQHDEEAGQRQREVRVRQHVAKRHEIHMGGLRGLFWRHAVAQREESEKRAGQQFQRAEHDPARPRAHQRDPPRRFGGAAVTRQEPQEVDLLADLRHQREHDGRRDAEQQQIEMTSDVAVLAGEFVPFRERVRAGPRNRGKGQDVQHNPERLGPELEAADQRNAIGHERDDRDRADEVADRARNTQAHLQRGRQDHRLDCEEDEGE